MEIGLLRIVVFGRKRRRNRFQHVAPLLVRFQHVAPGRGRDSADHVGLLHVFAASVPPVFASVQIFHHQRIKITVLFIFIPRPVLHMLEARQALSNTVIAEVNQLLGRLEKGIQKINFLCN